MSSIFAAKDSPFQQSEPDESTELRALSNALLLAEGFTLLFARCNQPDQRRRLAASLRERLPELNIQEIELREPISHLLDELRHQIAEPAPDVIFVSGLEYSLSVAAQAANTPFVANLNAARNSFSRYIPCPLVLWTPEYVLTAIMNGAPDFFSVRSGVYFFALSEQESSTFARSLSGGAEWRVEDLSINEKQERINHIENLLADYRILPQAQHDANAEARLLSRLGNLQTMVGRLSDAANTYRQLLKLSERTNNLQGQALASGFLANVFQKEGQTESAEQAYQYAIKLLTQSGKLDASTSILNNYALLLVDQGRFEEAEKLYLQSLHSTQIIQNSIEKATILSNIGTVYARQKKWKEAEISFVKSGLISMQKNHLAGMQQSMHNLGNVRQHEGRWNEAEQFFLQSLDTAHQLGDWDNEWRVLISLAGLYTKKGDFQNALKYAQQCVDISKSMENPCYLDEAYKFLADLRTRHESSLT